MVNPRRNGRVYMIDDIQPSQLPTNISAVIPLHAGTGFSNPSPSVPTTPMNNSDSPSNPASPRATLKLKGGPRKSPDVVKAPPQARPAGKAPVKPGAHWSDEYKKRMQADMDELTSK
jgi:hypothetical protein